MRYVYLLAAFLCLIQRLPEPSATPGDIVIVVNVSGLTLEEAGDEPWLASPCLNPEHCYFRPLGEAASNETYPALPGGAVDMSVPYRFRSCFLLEEGALGWRPWENHYAPDASGAFARVADAEAAGCVFEEDLCRARAKELIGALLAADPDCRVALCCVGGAFDTRFCVNFTRDGDKLLAALYAAPGSGIGDISSALGKAGEYIERRNADERRARRAAVIVISVLREDEGLFAEQTKKEALRLSLGATLLWASPLDADAEGIFTLLGFEREAPEPLPRPTARREGAAGLEALAR